MRERPILFSGSMVTAILEGRKTMTRRVAKYDHFVLRRMQGGYDFETFMRINPAYLAIPEVYESCPYGKPGDRLWVRHYAWYDREPLLAVGCLRSFSTLTGLVSFADGRAAMQEIYTATGANWSAELLDSVYKTNGSLVRRPGIHMPRWASQITLEITGVRVERLLDLSNADALAEGVLPEEGNCGFEWVDGVPTETPMCECCDRPVERFAELWDKINGKKHPWASNPWVWVVEFKNI